MGTEQGPVPGLPARTPGLPSRSPGLPSRSPGLPSRSPGLPSRSPGLPSRSPGLPSRDPGPSSRGTDLPTRTTRTRPPGRHRSPHQLSVPSDAPALILAIPGARTAESTGLAAGIVEVASQSCPGVAIRAGYLEGTEESLASVLAECHSPPGRPAAVVVPLTICPYPAVDAAVSAALAAAPVPALRGAPLGVHPLLAGALHARLAESGLARSDRIGRISIVTTAAEGILVAAIGQDAVPVAGTVAVLLAARLAVPVAAASLSDAATIRDAASRLLQAGVSGLALSPCVIGPEIGDLDLTVLADAAGMRTARPLGAQTAIGQLAAVRYGAALQDPKLVGTSG